MKIAIMSDSHDQWDLLHQAVKTANNRDCKYLLFAGDLVENAGIEALSKFDGQVNLVLGNNETQIVDLILKADAQANMSFSHTPNKGANRGDLYEEEIGGVKFFMNHYPRFAQLAAQSKQYNVCIHGHDHQYAQTQVENTLLLNPGTVGGVNAPATFMIFDTHDRSVEKINI